MTLEKVLKRHQATTVITILLFIATLLGWGYSAGRNSKVNDIQNVNIEQNANDVKDLSNKCYDVEHLILINNAKLELLLEHFDIESD